MDWKILKLIMKGFFKPRWPFCFLFGTSLIFLVTGLYIKDFPQKLIFSLSLQAVGVILISLWNLWPRSEARNRAGVQFATTFGDSVGPAFISFTNAIGVGLVLAALFIQISELINWFSQVMIILSALILIFGVINFVRNKP